MSKTLPSEQTKMGVNAVAEALGIEWRTALNRVNRGEFGDVEKVRVGRRVFRLVDAARVRKAAKKAQKSAKTAGTAEGVRA